MTRLTGYPPFFMVGDDPNEVIRKNKDANPSFDFESMNLVFTETERRLLSDFIKGLMNTNPSLRLSAKEALNHPVFTLSHLLKSAEEQKLLPKNKDLYLFLKYFTAHQIKCHLRRTKPSNRQPNRFSDERRKRRTRDSGEQGGQKHGVHRAKRDPGAGTGNPEPDLPIPGPVAAGEHRAQPFERPAALEPDGAVDGSANSKE